MTSVVAVLASAAAVTLLTQSATAANSPSYRDCAFAGGIDPDFVQLLGTTSGSNGTLTVPASQKSVQVKASESSDPGDSSGHDTLAITVSAPGVASQMMSGSGVGKVVLAVPLSTPGKTYTISWTATFDNGNHHCPGSQTPQNSSSSPFVVAVPSSGSTGGGPKPKPHKKHHRHRRHHGKGHGKY
jgi:hypothetical protein